MSELRQILHTPENLHEMWKEFSSRSRETYSSLVPSVTLKDDAGILITDFADITGIINYSNGIPFFKSVSISQELATYGMIDVDISGTIFGMNKFISSGMFLRLFGMYNNLELHFGWGENASLNSSGRYDPLFTHVPCNMITFKLKYVNAWSYDFTMTLQSNLSYFERNLDISTIGNPFNIDDFKFSDYIEEVDAKGNKVPGGQIVKRPYATLYTVLERIRKAVNDISAIKDKKRVFKEIRFEYAVGTLDLPDSEFAFPSIASAKRSLGDLKVPLEFFKTPDLFKGSLKTFLQSLLNLYPSSISNKITFFINEDGTNTNISFYNISQEYDKEKMEKSLVIPLNTQNSIIKSISFDYEKPLYALNLLRVYKDGKYYYGSDTTMAKKLAEEAGINFEKQSQTASPIYANIFKSMSQILNPTANAEPSKNENMENTLLQFINLTADMETLGFCGFHPGQGIIFQGDLLFDGKYIIKSVTHTISAGDFTTTNELMCLDASEAMKRLFA